MGVELHHPVAHDLHRDPADPGRRGAGCPLIDRGQRQQTPGLRAVLRRAGDRAQRMGIKVCPERNRHGEPPSFATLNQTCLKPTRPNRVIPSGTWYKTFAFQPLAAQGGSLEYATYASMISNHLAARGWRKLESGKADVIVGFDYGR